MQPKGESSSPVRSSEDASARKNLTKIWIRKGRYISMTKAKVIKAGSIRYPNHQRIHMNDTGDTLTIGLMCRQFFFLAHQHFGKAKCADAQSEAVRHNSSVRRPRLASVRDSFWLLVFSVYNFKLKSNHRPQHPTLNDGLYAYTCFTCNCSKHHWSPRFPPRRM